jgi:hypothetical protein
MIRRFIGGDLFKTLATVEERVGGPNEPFAAALAMPHDQSRHVRRVTAVAAGRLPAERRTRSGRSGKAPRDARAARDEARFPPAPRCKRREEATATQRRTCRLTALDGWALGRPTRPSRCASLRQFRWGGRAAPTSKAPTPQTGSTRGTARCRGERRAHRRSPQRDAIEPRNGSERYDVRPTQFFGDAGVAR